MKKRVLGKISAVILSAAMLFTLSGCGVTESGSQGSAAQGNAAQGNAAQGSTGQGNIAQSSTIQSSAAGDETVLVGLLHSMSGSMAISEQAVLDAEKLAIKEINEAGGVLGHTIVFQEEDGASDPSTFATKAEKLVDQDGVAAVFGCWTSSSRKAVKSIFEDYGSILFYPVQYEGMESSSNIIYTGAAPNQQIVPAVEYLIEQGYEKFFLLGSDYVFPRTANMIITAQVEAAGLSVVGEEYADMDQTDFAAIISKIEEAQPDVIVNTLNGTGNVSFFKQMSEKNYDSESFMTMSFSIAEEEVATIGADILKGHMVSWNYYQTTDTERNTSFVEAYKAEYGENRVTSDPVEAAYDAVYLWAAACEQAGSFAVEDVLAAIEAGGISFDAPEGTVEINGANHHLAKPVRIGEIREDGLIYEVFATEGVVDPDPYLETYDWAAAAGIMPLE